MKLARLILDLVVELPKRRQEGERAKAERLAKLRAAGPRGSRGYWAEAKRQSRARRLKEQT